ncbi:hypothetical protein P9112_010457 [Eukaryota sp. TZLM1-RC]
MLRSRLCPYHRSFFRIHRQFICEKGGSPRCKKFGGKTRETGCNFSVRVTHTESGWQVVSQSTSHNHQSYTCLSASRSFRQYYKDLFNDTIETLLLAICKPRAILDRLIALDPKCPLRRIDISNVKATLMKNQKVHLPTIKAMVDHLKNESLISVRTLIHTDDEGSLRNCMMSFKPLVDIVNSNPYVLMMNCTYKTNQYGLSLLVVMTFQLV